MSRLNQNLGGSEFLPNPCKKFLEMKNYYTKEVITVKGKDKEIKVFDKVGFTYQVSPEEEGGEWTSVEVDLPLEFAIISPNWTSFKGWNAEEKTYYRSNEVGDNKQTVNIRNKEGIVFSFTMEEMWSKVKGTKTPTERAKEIKAMLKELGVKQYASIYVALNEDGEFKLANFQLKGANLSGQKDQDSKNPSGWWNVSKKLKNDGSMLRNYHQFNDFLTENGELGEYGIINWTLGDVIDPEHTEALDAIYDELEAYHKFYADKKIEPEPVTQSDTDLNPDY